MRNNHNYGLGSKKPTKAEKEKQLMYREITLEIEQANINEKLKMAEERAIIGCIKNLSSCLLELSRPKMIHEQFSDL